MSDSKPTEPSATDKPAETEPAKSDAPPADGTSKPSRWRRWRRRLTVVVVVLVLILISLRLSLTWLVPAVLSKAAGAYDLDVR